MKTSLKVGLAFAAGLVAGVVGTYYVVRNQFQKTLDKELKSERDVLRRQVARLSEKYGSDTVVKGSEEDKKVADKISKENGYKTAAVSSSTIPEGEMAMSNLPDGDARKKVFERVRKNIETEDPDALFKSGDPDDPYFGFLINRTTKQYVEDVREAQNEYTQEDSSTEPLLVNQFIDNEWGFDEILTTYNVNSGILVEDGGSAVGVGEQIDQILGADWREYINWEQRSGYFCNHDLELVYEVIVVEE